MKRARFVFLVVWTGLFIVLSGISAAQIQKDSSSTVEVIIQGKKYKSVHDYRRKQIEDILKRSFSTQNLNEFEEEELCEIMKKIRAEQQMDRTPSKKDVPSGTQETNETIQERQTNNQNVEELSTTQMQEMLGNYLKEHEDAEPLIVDPNKVKNIILDPSKEEKEH